MGVPETETQLQQLAAIMPLVPFKGIQFLDIGYLLAHPDKMALCIDLLLAKLEPYKDEFSAIGCFDARGFLFGPILGLRLGKKVFMLRKPGKMPRVAYTVQYRKEYASDTKTGYDELCIQEGVLEQGEKVLLVDDVMATGGTMAAGVELVNKSK